MLTPEQGTFYSKLFSELNGPLAVAFSGGGDSTALLFLALKHARCKPVTAMIVDHGLREGSAKEASDTARTAKKMGANVEILKWTGRKPQTAIQEKARNARYKLLGEACRKLGIQKLLLGHNLDDQAETVSMRAQSGSGWRGLAGMRLHKQAPIWPQLFGVEIIRPLLQVSRNELRQFNAQNGLSYIDDPSNENPKFARVRTRALLQELPDVSRQLIVVARVAQDCLRKEREHINTFISKHTHVHEWGAISLLQSGLNFECAVLGESLKYLILAVSGQASSPTAEKIQSLAQNIKSNNFHGATLGGVRFVPMTDHILIVRDPGMVLGRRDKPASGFTTLRPGMPTIWDGRFLVTSSQKGTSAAPLMLFFEQLKPSEKQTLKLVPEVARAGLPAIVKDGTVLVSIAHKGSDLHLLRSLVGIRLQNLFN